MRISSQCIKSYANRREGQPSAHTYDSCAVVQRGPWRLIWRSERSYSHERSDLYSQSSDIGTLVFATGAPAMPLSALLNSLSGLERTSSSGRMETHMSTQLLKLKASSYPQ